MRMNYLQLIYIVIQDVFMLDMSVVLQVLMEYKFQIEFIIQKVKEYTKTDADDEIFNIYEIGMRDKLFFSTVNITAFLHQQIIN